MSGILHLHLNEHPRPLSGAVARAIGTAGPAMNRYPSASQAVGAAVASLHQVAPDRLIVGAGSTEIITLAWRAFTDTSRAAFFHIPAFDFYPLIAAQCSTPVVTAPLPAADSWAHELETMELDGSVGLVALSNPHNPGGDFVSRRSIAQLAARLPPTTVVLNDEAYYEYADAPPDDLALAQLTELPNVVTTRTFSKIYGLAGLRIGYAVAHPSLVRRLQTIQSPFTVSQVAAVAGLAALADTDVVASRRAANRSTRERLRDDLAARGFQVRPSQANFVLAVPPQGVPWPAELLARGIRVKPVGGALRITVGAPEEMDGLVRAIDDILNNKEEPCGHSR
jgi:histidinol-phosphate aminotransferase